MKAFLKKIVLHERRSRSAALSQIPGSGSVASSRLPAASSDCVPSAQMSQSATLSSHLDSPPQHHVPSSVCSRSSSFDGLAALPTTPLPVTNQLTPNSTAISSTTPSSNTKMVTKNIFKTTLVLANAALTGIPIPAKGAITAAIKLIDIAEKTAANREALQALDGRFKCLTESIVKPLKGKKDSQVPAELMDSLERLTDGLQRLCEDSMESNSGIMFAAINSEDDSAKIEDINRRVTQLLDSFSLENHISGTIFVEHIDRKQDRHILSQLLQNLRIAPASYDSYTAQNTQRSTCFEGTREKLLGEIAVWISGVDGSRSPIYVLDGIAGIGKSTVAQTVAERAAALDYLGASFFFSRNEEERKNGKLFFGTIAFQLSLYDHEFATRIGTALEHIPDAATKRLPDQLKSLIIDPLRGARSSRTRPILIVIDALDECEAHNAKEILTLLAIEINQLPFLKVFITTRPELHIRDILRNQRHHERFYLHEIEHSIVETDIRLYLDHQLSGEIVHKALPDFEPAFWEPSRKDTDALVRLAGKLFIIASTAILFILDNKRYNPPSQLQKLLQGVARDYSGQNPMNTLDDVYIQILRTAFPDNSDDDMIKYFQEVVGTIVLLRDPLPCRSLANLLGIKPVSIITTLNHLHSIIAPGSQDQSPRIHHKSFPDFVTDAERCRKDSRFFIAPNERHCKIVEHCFRIMDLHLQQNVCNLGFPERYMGNSKTRHLVERMVTPELGYACSYWAAHLSEASQGSDHLLRLLDTFAFDHLLHWLEVLSWIGRLDVAYPSLEHAQRFVMAMTNVSGRLHRMLRDACRFLLEFYQIIKHSALHVYYSALTLSPSEASISQTYSTNIHDRMITVGGVAAGWNSLLAVLPGRTRVESVAFSSDGGRLVSTYANNTAKLWNSTMGTPIATLEGNPSSAEVKFSPDGARLANCANVVTLWDGVTGSLLTTPEGGPRPADLIFSPDGARLASSGGLWDGTTGVLITKLQYSVTKIEYPAWFNWFSFSPDSTRLACIPYDHQKTVILWDGVTGFLVAILEGHSRTVNTAVFSPRARLASASDDKTVRLWNGETGTFIASLDGHLCPVASVIFTSDGARLASGSPDTIKLWDGTTGAPIATLQGLPYLSYGVTFSPDGTRIVSMHDKILSLSDGTSGALIATLKGHSNAVQSATFSHDNARIASASKDQTVRLWDGITGTHITTLRGHIDYATSVVFSSDGARIASASYDGTVRLWDGSDGAAPITLLECHETFVNSVAVSSDGTRLASASSDMTVKLWNGITGALIDTLKGHSASVNFVAFSSNGNRLASASNDKNVGLWNSVTGTCIAMLEGHLGKVDSVTFSPDGARHASRSRDKTVKLWHSDTGALISTLEGHLHWINSVMFSSDGARITTGSRDHTVRLWNGYTGDHIATLEGHSDSVNSVAFSCDCARLASASDDMTIRLWGEGGAFITTLGGHSDQVYCVTFSSDGSQLASCSYDDTIKIWDGLTGAAITTIYSHADPCTLPQSFSTSMLHSSWSFIQDISTSLWYIAVSLLNDTRHIQNLPLCWFPSGLEPKHLAFGASLAIVGCKGGQVIIFDISELLALIR